MPSKKYVLKLSSEERDILAKVITEPRVPGWKILRARALLKFFPGWGNVVCGAVAGAGTYAIGRAAIVYFLEGFSLKDARRTYLSSRKKRSSREPEPIRQIEAAR